MSAKEAQKVSSLEPLPSREPSIADFFSLRWVLHLQFPGQIIFNAEDDTHYPVLTVAQTLQFALKMKTPRVRPNGQSRKQFEAGELNSRTKASRSARAPRRKSSLVSPFVVSSRIPRHSPQDLRNRARSGHHCRKRERSRSFGRREEASIDVSPPHRRISSFSLGARS